MKILFALTGTFIIGLFSFIYLKITLPLFALLDTADKWLLEILNFDGGQAADSFFYFVSSKMAWVPIGVMFLALLLTDKKYRRKTFFIVIAIALTVTLADQISSSLIKPAIGRLRPSHCDAISGTLHYVNNYRSGRFGFCSSHAANSTGVLVLLSLIMRKRAIIIPLAIWTILVCYSRIYLGVHYPGDIICGCLVGAVSGASVFRGYRYVYLNYHKLRMK